METRDLILSMILVWALSILIVMRWTEEEDPWWVILLRFALSPFILVLYALEMIWLNIKH